MDGYRKYGQAVFDIKYHIIWVTKYRYKILHGPIAYRVKELIRQWCQVRVITILQRSVGKVHIHLLISCPPCLPPNKNITVPKRKILKIFTRRISRTKETLLGTALMGKRLFLCNCRSRYRRNNIGNQFTEERNEIFKIEDEF